MPSTRVLLPIVLTAGATTILVSSPRASEPAPATPDSVTVAPGVAAFDSTPAPPAIHGARGRASVTPRSPGTALALSAGCTLIPLAVAGLDGETGLDAELAIGALLLGPAAGYFYGDCANRGVGGILFRVACLGAGLGIAVAGGDSHSEVPVGLAWVAAGAVLGTGAALYDIGMVSEHVERRNAERLREARVEPVLRAGADGRPQAGLAVREDW